jgi:hypothetical protein
MRNNQRCTRERERETLLSSFVALEKNVVANARMSSDVEAVDVASCALARTFSLLISSRITNFVNVFYKFEDRTMSIEKYKMTWRKEVTYLFHA